MVRRADPRAVTDKDRHFMRRCLVLAEQALGRTSPNPMVGCVVVGRDGHVLAEGFHAGPGTLHAEASALEKLGGRAPGATLYVNLEPCRHTTRRLTTPCLPKVAVSGAARVVYGLRDPFPGHGGGLGQLEKKGIVVVGPVEEDACRTLNEAFVAYATLGRPHVTLKAAVTLDGRIATRTGDSQWITGDAARHYGHFLRDVSDAILVGAGTVLADDPALTTRGIPGGRNPLRVVVDGRLRVSAKARVFDPKAGPVWLVTSRDTNERALAPFRRRGVVVHALSTRAGRIAVPRILKLLAAAGHTRLLVEGGGDTHAGFWRAGTWDRLALTFGPLAVGGPAPGWLGGPGAVTLSRAGRLVPEGEPRWLGDDLLVHYRR